MASWPRADVRGHRHRGQARRVQGSGSLPCSGPATAACAPGPGPRGGPTANGNAIEQSRLYSVLSQKLVGKATFFDEIVPLWPRSAPYSVQLTPLKYVHTWPVIHIRVVESDIDSGREGGDDVQTHHHRVLRGLKLSAPRRRSGGRAGAEIRDPPRADQGRRRHLRRQGGRRAHLLEEAGRALSRPGRGRGDDRGAHPPRRGRVAPDLARRAPARTG